MMMLLVVILADNLAGMSTEIQLRSRLLAASRIAGDNVVLTIGVLTGFAAYAS